MSKESAALATFQKRNVQHCPPPPYIVKTEKLTVILLERKKT
jgi:hypothetical protein